VPLRSMDALEVSGRRALVRLDLNVPVKDGHVMDETRIHEAAPTVGALAGRGATVVCCSHLGRAKGKPDPALSLAPVAPILASYAGCPVRFVDDVAGAGALDATRRARPGDVLLLENLRFEPGEEANDPAFCDRLRELGDVYVNDAFGTAHRAHASTAGVAVRFAERAAGPLMAREIEALARIRDHPDHPFVAVVGGAKIAGKLETLRALAARADTLALVGGMANTFLLAQGIAVGRSLVEPDLVPEARAVLDEAARRGTAVLLPDDVVAAPNPDARGRACRLAALAPDDMILDIGESSRSAVRAAILAARTVFWNGPAGVFERTEFAGGTLVIAQAMAECAGFTVVGGGESVMAVHQAGVAGRIGHVSTGGGASLEFLAGETLPGVVALEV